MNHTSPSDRKQSVCTIVLISFVLCHGSLVGAGQIATCDHVKDLFNVPLSTNLFARQLALEQAVGVVDRSDPPCNLVLSERARWAYADALDKYSRSAGFPNDVAQSWATKAATAYESYLQWFANLDEKERKDMIAVLMKTNTSAADFKTKERSWLLYRVGGTLVSLGAVYVRFGMQTTLLSTFSRVAEENPTVFPQEAVVEWFKWLQAQSEFKRQKSKEEMRALIRESVECASSWQAFDGFLQQFVLQNPSVAKSWKVVLEDLKKWL